MKTVPQISSVAHHEFTETHFIDLVDVYVDITCHVDISEIKTFHDSKNYINSYSASV